LDFQKKKEKQKKMSESAQKALVLPSYVVSFLENNQNDGKMRNLCLSLYTNKLKEIFVIDVNDKSKLVDNKGNSVSMSSVCKIMETLKMIDNSKDFALRINSILKKEIAPIIFLCNGSFFNVPWTYFKEPHVLLDNKCANCFDNKLQTDWIECTKCKRVIYCSNECREKHWEKTHKSLCEYMNQEKSTHVDAIIADLERYVTNNALDLIKIRKQKGPCVFKLHKKDADLAYKKMNDANKIRQEQIDRLQHDMDTAKATKIPQITTEIKSTKPEKNKKKKKQNKTRTTNETVFVATTTMSNSDKKVTTATATKATITTKEKETENKEKEKEKEKETVSLKCQDEKTLKNWISCFVPEFQLEAIALETFLKEEDQEEEFKSLPAYEHVKNENSIFYTTDVVKDYLYLKMLTR
jgi:hypothetical protein